MRRFRELWGWRDGGERDHGCIGGSVAPTSRKNEFLAFAVHAGAAAFDELREAVARLGRPDKADADLISGHRLPGP